LWNGGHRKERQPFSFKLIYMIFPAKSTAGASPQPMSEIWGPMSGSPFFRWFQSPFYPRGIPSSGFRSKSDLKEKRGVLHCLFGDPIGVQSLPREPREGFGGGPSDQRDGHEHQPGRSDPIVDLCFLRARTKTCSALRFIPCSTVARGDSTKISEHVRDRSLNLNRSLGS
jgi:hypothetical protein